MSLRKSSSLNFLITDLHMVYLSMNMFPDIESTICMWIMDLVPTFLKVVRKWTFGPLLVSTSDRKGEAIMLCLCHFHGLG